MVIHQYAKISYAYVKEQIHFARLNSRWKYNDFDIEVEGQGHTELMNDTLTCQTMYDYVKGQKHWGLNTKPCHKHNKFDLEVKVQRRIRIMNVLDTLSHGDRHMCQIWYANGQRPSSNLEWMYATHRLMVIYRCSKYGKPMSIQKKGWAGHESAQTEGQTEGGGGCIII